MPDGWLCLIDNFLTHNPKSEGLNPVADTGKEKIPKQDHMVRCAPLTIILTQNPKSEDSNYTTDAVK
jgi:hypothetical protein